MSRTSPETLDVAWAVIERHLSEVADLVPSDIARTLDPHGDLDELVPRLVQTLAGRVPEIEVPGLTPWVSGAREAPPIAVGRFGVTISTGGYSSLAAQCQGLANDLVRLFSTRRDFLQPVQGDTREWAAQQVSRRIALGVLTARAAMSDLGRVTPLQDPEGLRLGVMNGLRLAAMWRLLNGGPGKPRTAVSIDYCPQGYRDLATVENHQWWLVEPGAGGPDLPDEAFRDNGLVSVIPGGVVVRTGVPRGRLFVTLTMADSAPTEPSRTWSEIVEVSFTATVGGAAIAGMARGATALEPGDYRVRVMARRRDDAEDPDGVGGEEYEVVVWAAPSEPARVWAAGDGLGLRLRGVPEPPPVVHPETAYRWIDRFMNRGGATVTIASGVGVEELISAFGGDPTVPAAALAPGDMDQRLLVGVLGNGVVAIEPDGWQGNRPEVLRRVSVNGRVASLYWNVNAVERFAAAEAGEMLDKFEYWSHAESPRILELSEDLDRDTYVDTIARGLVVAERFTGVAVTETFVTELLNTGRAHDLLPQLPDHHPFVDQDGYSFGPLLNEKHSLLAASEQELRDITWWAVGEIAAHYGADDPEVAATLQSRSLSPAAVIRAREAEIFIYPGGNPLVAVWRALYSATNPDPVAAMVAVAQAVGISSPWQIPILESLRRRLTDPDGHMTLHPTEGH